MFTCAQLSLHLIVIVFAFLLPDGKSYLGSGSSLIEQSIQEETIFPAAFLIKMLFTAVTLGGGFKGGEIVPSFLCRRSFGCFLWKPCRICSILCAAMGMVAVFCGVTNCPITSILIAFELFGFDSATTWFYPLQSAMQCLVIMVFMQIKQLYIQSIEQSSSTARQTIKCKADIRNPLPLLNSNCMNWSKKHAFKKS